MTTIWCLEEQVFRFFNIASCAADKRDIMHGGIAGWKFDRST
jgi:hypothetical protein